MSASSTVMGSSGGGGGVFAASPAAVFRERRPPGDLVRGRSGGEACRPRELMQARCRLALPSMSRTRALASVESNVTKSVAETGRVKLAQLRAVHNEKQPRKNVCNRRSAKQLYKRAASKHAKRRLGPSIGPRNSCILMPQVQVQAKRIRSLRTFLTA